MGRYSAWLEAERGLALRRVRGRLAVVGRRPGRVLVVDLGLLRVSLATPPTPGARRRADARRPLVPGRDAQLRRACAAVPGSRPTTRSCLGRSQTRPRSSLTVAELREQVARCRPAWCASASGAATGWRRTRPTSPRPSCDARHGAASARSSPPARPSSAPARVVDRWRRSSRRCCSPSTATGTATARRPPAEVAADPGRPAVAEATRVVPYLRAERRRRRRPGCRAPGPTLLAERRAADVRAGAVRPSAVRALLVRHDRPAQADRARPRRHPARAPQDAGAAHAISARATGSAGSPPPAG